jgi:hypothetical protein
MSLLHPFPSTRSSLPRRLLQLASLGLAGLLVGVLAGCSSSDRTELTSLHNDTDWQMTSDYASATAALGASNSIRSPRVSSCVSAPCEVRVSASHISHQPGR